VPTGVTVDLAEVLRQWEQAGAVFPAGLVDKMAPSGRRSLALLRCGTCGFGRFDPMIAGDAVFYRAVVGPDYYVKDKWEFEIAAADIAEAGARRVLDIGCGTGHFLRYLRGSASQLDLIGHDLDAGCLATVQQAGFGTLAEIPDRPGDDELFDAVTLLQVLEHLGEPIADLARFVRLLRPGGILIITTPDDEGPVRHFSTALTEVPPHHVTRWRESTFHASLPRLGLCCQVVRHEPLPDYLWHSYLPVLWNEGIWPARFFEPLADRAGIAEPLARIAFAIDAMRAAGLRRLHGVPGHTIYVRAQKE
jgi:SAM-dependent methyltransferase